MNELKSYDQSEESEEFEDEVKRKFQLLELLGQLHNIIVHTHSSAGHTAEFVELASRMISLDN